MGSSWFSRVFCSVLFFVFIGISWAHGLIPEKKILPSRLSFRDYYGRLIRVDKPAQTIVSLSPSLTETIFSLGYGDRLIGRSTWCDYPKEAGEIPSLGDLDSPDIELLVTLNPDIILASSHFPPRVLEKLEGLGLRVAVLSGLQSFQGTYDAVIRPTALLLGDRRAGEELIDSMEGQFAQARRRVSASSEKPSIYYVLAFGEGGDWTAGGDTFIGEMMGLAGARNIAQEVRGWAYSLEALLGADPDIVVIPSWAAGLFSRTPLYSQLRAVREGRVFVINPDLLERQGPRLAEGFGVLVDIIGSYP